MSWIITEYFFIILFFGFGVRLRLSEGYDTYYNTCGPPSTANINLQSNLRMLFSTLKSEAYSSNIGFANTTINAGTPNQFKGLFMCYIAARPDVCSECLNSSLTNAATICPNSSTATFTYGWCDLRYSNSQNFIAALTLDRKTNVFKSKRNVLNSSSTINSTVSELLNSLRLEAMNSALLYAFGNKTDPGMNQVVYGLVQCTRDLHPDDCGLCVQFAIGNITSNDLTVKPPRTVTAISTGCFADFRFSAYYVLNFTSLALAPAPSPPNLPSPPHLPPSITGSHSKTIIIVVVSTCLIFVLILGFTIWLWGRKRTNHNLTNPNSSEENEISSQEFIPKELQVFDLKTLRAATNNFSKENKLGEGGFGPVYKGTLPTGKEIAVKKLREGSKQGGKEFEAEVRSLAAFKHRNLVELVGYCKDRKEIFLCYEYLPNGSLDNLLFDRNNDNNQALNWTKRYNIAKGISRGLHYLHEGCKYKIVHRDLKTENILIDKDLDPKISDFGTAKFFNDDLTHKFTMKPICTLGYVAPEYLHFGKFSFKSDVYSFGIILLEIVTGQKSRTPDPNAPPTIIEHVIQKWVDGTIEELKDPNMGEAPIEEIKRCIHIGLLCVNNNTTRRPTMGEIDLMLQGYLEVPPVSDEWLMIWMENLSSLTENDSECYMVKTNYFSSET